MVGKKLARAALPVDNINGLNKISENNKSRFVQVELGWKDVLRTQTRICISTSLFWSLLPEQDIFYDHLVSIHLEQILMGPPIWRKPGQKSK